MPQVARGGQIDISIPAGQSLVVGSYGAGLSKIYTAAPLLSALPPVYVLYSVISGGSTYITFASATSVRIEASTGCDIEYDYGAQPLLLTSNQAATTGLTAFAGGGQANATALTGNINRITTCATTNDSVKLPLGTVGRRQTLYNGGASTAAVFPQTGESINSGAVNASFSVAATKSAAFECVATGLWNALLGA